MRPPARHRASSCLQRGPTNAGQYADRFGLVGYSCGRTKDGEGQFFIFGEYWEIEEKFESPDHSVIPLLISTIEDLDLQSILKEEFTNEKEDVHQRSKTAGKHENRV